MVLFLFCYLIFDVTDLHLQDLQIRITGFSPFCDASCMKH